MDCRLHTGENGDCPKLLEGEEQQSMDDPVIEEQLAAFRYSLIAPIVSRQTPMLPGELTRQLQEIASRSYTIPGSHRTVVSVRSLERYIAGYRKNGWEGLKPRPRSKTNNRGVAPEVLQQAIDLRKERPERSVEQLIYLLERSGIAKPGEIAASTLSRNLRQAGLSRKELLQETHETHRRFEVDDVHLMWQADFQQTLFLPDPKDPKKKKKAILCAIIDAYSRVCVHAEFYWDEKLPRLEDSLKKAILMYGLPQQFYCDNGAAFSSHHLLRICARLGIRLSHSRPYKPEGRGRIERFFRFIDTSFKPEAYEKIEKKEITFLPELNLALMAWIDGYYHIRKHGSIGCTPLEKAATCKRAIRRVTMAELAEIFLWEESRKVDKTGCVSVFGNTYEVSGDLSGEKVNLRFDPFDLKVIQVWHDGTRYPDAVPLDLTRSIHERVKSDKTRAKESPKASQEIDFFLLAEEKRRSTWAEDPLTFAAKEEVKPDGRR
jgi:transposase InsO family protein